MINPLRALTRYVKSKFGTKGAATSMTTLNHKELPEGRTVKITTHHKTKRPKCPWCRSKQIYKSIAFPDIAICQSLGCGRSSVYLNPTTLIK